MKPLLLFASLAALFVGPSMASAQSALDKLIEAAKKETELNFMAGASTLGGQETMAKLEAAFNKKFGTNMKLRFTPGPSMPAIAVRLAQEHKAGAKATTDIFIGPLGSYGFLKREGVLTEVDWAGTFPWITPDMELSKGLGVLIWTSVSGIVYNPNLLKAADAPKTNEDLIDPAKSKAWAGKMSMPPYPDWMVELSLIWPREKVVDFARKLTSSAVGFIRYNELERVANGEFALMANEADAPGGTAIWAAKGASLAFNVSSDPAQVYYFQLSVPKNSANPNLAKLFVAFMATPEAQAITDAGGYSGSHLTPSTRVSKFIAANKIKLIPAQQYVDFYDKGGDPALTEEINRMLKR